MIQMLKAISVITVINISGKFDNINQLNFEVKNNCRIVYLLSKVLEIKHADIVTAKARLETLCGCAGVGKSKNNLFGFRKTKEYINFNSILQCLNYYKSWQDKHFDEKKYKSYFEFLSHSGWIDGKKKSERMKNYINKLKKVWTKEKYL